MANVLRIKFVVILLAVTQIFAIELIFGGRTIRPSDSDSVEIIERTPEFFMDSLEVAALTGIRGQTMDGGRSRAQVTRYINRNANSVRREARDHIRRGNRISGGMIIRFKINSAGEVFEARIVESNIGDTAFEVRVAQTVLTWQFPPIDVEDDITIVEYPFVFDQI